MAIYRKGKETKEKIYLVAKKLLYENGYKKTTTEKIANVAEVPVGLVHYYYKKKTDIVSQIYFDFIKAISLFLRTDNNVANLIENSLMKHMVISHIFYNIIFNDEKNKMIYYEIITQQIAHDKVIFSLRNSLRNIISEFNLNISEELLKEYLIYEYGGRQQLFLYHFDNITKYNLDDNINFVVKIMPQLIGINKDIIDDYLDKSLKVVDKLDYSNIKFLV